MFAISHMYNHRNISSFLLKVSLLVSVIIFSGYTSHARTSETRSQLTELLASNFQNELNQVISYDYVLNEIGIDASQSEDYTEWLYVIHVFTQEDTLKLNLTRLNFNSFKSSFCKLNRIRKTAFSDEDESIQS